MNDLVVFANLVNLCGVVLLVISHTILSVSESKNTYILSILGGTVIVFGSLILKSYPPVVLNLFWVLISALALIKNNSQINKNRKKQTKKTLSLISSTTILFLVLSHFYLLELNFIDSISMATAFIYSAGYLSLILGFISKRAYLSLCLVGFIMFAPHLIEKLQITLLINEFYGAIVAIFGILKINRINAEK